MFSILFQAVPSLKSMTYKTHIAFAATVGLYPLYLLQNHGVLEQAQLSTLTGLFFVGAIAPDIDHTRSYISQRIPILPHLIAFYTRHRGFTHSALGLTFLALVLSVAHFTLEIDKSPLIAFWFGYLLHIAGDALTLSGIKNFCCGKTLYLFPKFLRFKTGSPKELLFFTLFSALTGYEYLLFFDQAHMPEIQRLLQKTLHTINSLL